MLLKLLSLILNLLLTQIFSGTVDLWPYLLLLNVIPAFFSLVILPFLPDSPRYLLLVKQKRLAAEKGMS